MSPEEYLLERGARSAAPWGMIGVLEDGTVVRQARENAAKTPPTLMKITLRDLRMKEFKQLSEPVEGLIVEGLTLFCGASKIGKSWFALQMGCAVADGKPFLGYSTQGGDVLYCALEDSERRLQKRSLNFSEYSGENLTLAVNCQTIKNGLLEQLRDWVQGVERPRMIIIDTLQKVRGDVFARGNAYAIDYDVMSKLKSFADDNHVALVLVHHLNKSQDEQDPYNKISGSTGLMGAADTTILLTRERGSSDAKIMFTGRDVESDNFMIRWTGKRWTACSAEAREREIYESSPIVATCRALLGRSFGEVVKITLQDFLDASIPLSGGLAAATKNELSKKLQQLSPLLLQYDDITIKFKDRVNSKRGLWIMTGTGRGDFDDSVKK